MSSHNPGSGDYVGTSSHAASDSSQVHTRAVMYPHIWTDLQRSETCEFDDLLGVLLSRCRHETTPKIPQSHRSKSSESSPTNISQCRQEITQRPPDPAVAPTTPRIPHSPENKFTESSPHGSDATEKDGAAESSADEASRKDLFDKCLLKVLPLCNDNRFRGMIQSFCDASDTDETNRYAPFVEACNYALEQLRTLDIEEIWSSTDCDALFHVNHDRHIKGHNDSQRIPDVVVVSLPVARRAQDVAADTNRSSLVANCARKPTLGFEWQEVFAFVEFKRDGRIEPSFPDAFDHRLNASIPACPIAGDPSPGGSVPSSSNHTSVSASIASKSSSSRSESNSLPMSGLSIQPVAEGSSVLGTDQAAHPALLGSVRGTRRRHDQVDPGSESYSKKGNTKKPRPNQEVQDGLKQCGGYAAEMLSASAGRTHAIGLLIVDAIVRAWWYDRQGAIQTTGLDLVRDLPRFVLLLLIMQRFRRADWGHLPALDEVSEPGVQIDNIDDPADTGDTRFIRIGELNVDIHLGDVVHNTLCLVGRGTNVFGATSNHSRVAGISLVAKLSWPNKARASEKSIIDRAVKAAPAAKDHLPKVFGSRDFCDTSGIREQLGISEDSQKPSRVFRVTLFERLYPITMIRGPACVAAYVQCVKCHYLVWQNGVQHRDLSVSNLMVRVQDQQYLGVLNDWDLAFAKGLSVEVNEHTATLFSLSLNLLTPEYWDGTIDVEYRHDLESFVWIIFWLAKCRNGKVPRSIRTWITGIKRCYADKLAFISSFKRNNSPIHTIEWRVANPLLEQLKLNYASPMSLSRDERILPPTLKLYDVGTDRELLDAFLELLPKECLVPASPVLD